MKLKKAEKTVQSALISTIKLSIRDSVYRLLVFCRKPKEWCERYEIPFTTKKAVLKRLCEWDYFYCEVSEIAENRNLDDNEQEYGYQVSWMTLDDAIELNKSVQNYNNIPWIEGETLVMKRMNYIH